MAEQALGPRAQPRPQRDLQPKMTVAELDDASRRRSTGRAISRPPAWTRRTAVVVRQPDYFQAAGRDRWRARPCRTLAQYLTFKLLDALRARASSPFEEAAFDFRGKTLQRLQENRPALEARRGEVTEGALGEALGKLYVERHFPPESKARMEQLVKNLLQAYTQGIDQLDWMSPATKAQAQAQAGQVHRRRSATRTSGATTPRCVIKRDDLVGNVHARERVRVPADRSPSWASRSTARVGHDAADGERLLQPDA